MAEGIAELGFDFITVLPSDFLFEQGKTEHLKTISENSVALITDWDSFDRYIWRNPEDYKFAIAGLKLPYNMKILVKAPGGVLEVMTGLMGYDNMCIALIEDP